MTRSPACQAPDSTIDLSNMKNIAVILAAGSGSRFGGDKPKQFWPLEDGRTVLEHAVAAFRRCEEIDDVWVVVNPLHLETARELVDCRLVAGGRERWESSWNAIREAEQMLGREAEQCNLLIHDAARPFVSERIISDVCAALEQHEAVTVAVPATDTIYRVCDDSPTNKHIAEIPDRATMMRAQTPQAFRLSLIRKAYEVATQDPNLQVTDDCGIVHRYMPETPICVVTGDEQNRKITFKEDI